MKVKIFAAAAVLLSVFILTSCGKYSKGDKLVTEAVDYYKAENYTAALDALKEAEDSKLKSTKEEVLYFYLGETYFKTGDYEKSIEYHRKATEFEPELFKSYVTIGVCQRKLGNEKEALKAYSEALLYDPQNSDSVGLYVSLGSLYIANGKPYTAIDYLEKAEAIYPEHPAAHAYLAIAYAMAYEYAMADNQLALAVAHGYDNIGEVKERIDEIKNAHDSVPVKITPKNGE